MKYFFLFLIICLLTKEAVALKCVYPVEDGSVEESPPQIIGKVVKTDKKKELIFLKIDKKEKIVSLKINRSKTMLISEYGGLIAVSEININSKIKVWTHGCKYFGEKKYFQHM